jgi:hypothetical protein
MDAAPPALPAPPVPLLVASMNKWTLDLARDRADVTSFGDTNKQYVQGLPDVKGTLGGFWDAPNVEIFDVAMGDTPAFLSLIPSSLDSTYAFEGMAFLDAGLDVDSSGAVTINGSYVAAGEWKRLPAGAMRGRPTTDRDRDEALRRAA